MFFLHVIFYENHVQPISESLESIFKRELSLLDPYDPGFAGIGFHDPSGSILDPVTSCRGLRVR